ncbi:phage integrase SAM-like domain-containing protein [Chitinophaga tropicalis]|uniref:Tyrosine-type recombinase/integrase n=1 Tax=Chitinophaga tropicalis TaxID=2683588 RepID=A0A7K1UDB4_9BACT|nr:phage integrase SAM-like domain-containing protein [Chitinophaga tropicalis]MVT12362.1 tyrosine-type recombinase/integrase [Chitinophaga tropicalis]
MEIPDFRPVHNWRNHINQNGRYKIHIRIRIGKSCRYHDVKLPQKVTVDEWSGKENAWVKPGHPYHFEINNAIDNTLTLLRELNKRYYTAKRQLTFAIIFKELQKEACSSILNTYFHQIVIDPPEALQPATIGRYKSALIALNKFRHELFFYDLDEKLFLELCKFMKREMNLKASTIFGYFNAYRKVIHWAQLDGYISPLQEDAIFSNIHISRGKPLKDHLDVNEIKAWKEFTFNDAHQNLVKVRDMFLLQVYTGFYYSDLKALQKSELHKDQEYGYYIYRGRFKNGNLAIVPLWKFPYAIALIKKYYSLHPSDPYLLDRDAFMEDHVYNRQLKEIASLLQWRRNVRNKLARQTNSQLYIRYGANIPVLSRMLGHQKQETTSEYFEVSLADVIEGTRSINFEQLGIC